MARGEASPALHLSGRRLLVWTAVATVAWLVNSVATTAQYHQMQEAAGAPASWSSIARTSVASDLLWVPVTLLALVLAHRCPLGSGRLGLRNLGWHGLALGAVVLGRAAAVVTFNEVVGWYPVVPPWPDLLLTSIANNLALYALLTGLAHALYYAGLARAREAQFQRARTAAVSAQLQPHFLFNSLNAIAESIHSDPVAAERMAVDLASLLRHALSLDQDRPLTIEDEMSVGAAYLAIEQHRFSDRLVVTWSLDPAVRHGGVPPLLLQPLLENAVRHGLAPTSGRRTLVAVTAQADEGDVVIAVEDDGAGYDAAGAPGRGTSIVRERLRLTHGERGVLTISARPDGGCRAEVRLPFKAVEPEAHHVAHTGRRLEVQP